MKKNKVYLTLQNGKVFEGFRFGAVGEVVGELVFTTGMTGYLETLTDPSYYGQIVTQTFPLIGNYGVIPEDFESKKPWVSAYIVREVCDYPSNFRSEGTLNDYLEKSGIVGVYGIDTRELTRIVRETGVMNACISSKPLKDFETLKKYRVTNAVKSVTCSERIRQSRLRASDGSGLGLRLQEKHYPRTFEARLCGSESSRVLHCRTDSGFESRRSHADERTRGSGRKYGNY